MKNHLWLRELSGTMKQSERVYVPSLVCEREGCGWKTSVIGEE